MKLTVIRILLFCVLFLITLLPLLQYLSPRTPLREGGGKGRGAEGTERCLFLTSQNLFKRYKTKGKEIKKNETHMKRRG